MQGVANTAETHINAAAAWYRKHLKDEAVGSIIHEEVHVVQQYGHSRVPGWLVEGIADYIRFYLFEPQLHAAEIAPRRAPTVRYDNSYRVTANFLNWVTTHGHPDLVKDLNAAARKDRYTDKLWEKLTGQSLEDLGATWQQALAK